MPTTFNPKKNYNRAAPKRWKKVSDGLKYGMVAIIGTMATTTVIPSDTANIITFVMSVVIVVLKSVDVSLGVSEEKID